MPPCASQASLLLCSHPSRLSQLSLPVTFVMPALRQAQAAHMCMRSSACKEGGILQLPADPHNSQCTQPHNK